MNKGHKCGSICTASACAGVCPFYTPPSDVEPCGYADMCSEEGRCANGCEERTPDIRKALGLMRSLLRAGGVVEQDPTVLRHTITDVITLLQRNVVYAEPKAPTERSAEPTRAGTERHTRNEPDPESGISPGSSIPVERGMV